MLSHFNSYSIQTTLNLIEQYVVMNFIRVRDKYW